MNYENLIAILFGMGVMFFLFIFASKGKQPITIVNIFTRLIPFKKKQYSGDYLELMKLHLHDKAKVEHLIQLEINRAKPQKINRREAISRAVSRWHRDNRSWRV